jgi:hypothetical protein
MVFLHHYTDKERARHEGEDHDKQHLNPHCRCEGDKHAERRAECN